ncbi:MAG: hypothetical protein ACI8RY_000582 [Urechidicola sp.]|jgi:hypothetical protein|tara:strand:+ start:897 stop:1115 length:219 start_codon:yes stop_codon:yes gene_type:complete
MSFLDKLINWIGFGKKTILLERNSVPRDDYDYNQIEAKIKKQVDNLLDKIKKKGIESLTLKEKKFLDRESKR